MFSIGQWLLDESITLHTAAFRGEISKINSLLDVEVDINIKDRCMVPECDGMIGYEKKIPSKEELWDKYYMGAPEQQRQFVEQYKVVKRA